MTNLNKMLQYYVHRIIQNFMFEMVFKSYLQHPHTNLYSLLCPEVILLINFTPKP